MASSLLYQGSLTNSDILKAEYVNQRLQGVQAPAAIIDAAVVQFRAHIKTHKTIEGTKLQAGDAGPIRLIVSTIAELEHILPWLKECIKAGRDVINVLYGVPASPSSIPRLAKIAHMLGSSNYISVMVDNPTTLDYIKQNHSLFPGPVPVFIKIDTGYNRAGVMPSSTTLSEICAKLEDLALEHAASILGLYSHLGHSYAFSTPLESLEGLLAEFETLRRVADQFFAGKNLHLSVGATPTATASQVLKSELVKPEAATEGSIGARWTTLKKSGLLLEIHAGVYPFLDMQQLATHARTTDLDYSNIGLRMLVEVASLYTERAKPEALIAAGSLALGREPCKSYPGWGVVSPWSSTGAPSTQIYSEASRTGWIVGRISQEHGILTYEGEKAGMRELQIGEKLLVWPNHACIAGAGMGWYLVVDSDIDEGADVVRDVWVRCRGW